MTCPSSGPSWSSGMFHLPYYFRTGYFGDCYSNPGTLFAGDRKSIYKTRQNWQGNHTIWRALPYLLDNATELGLIFPWTLYCETYQASPTVCWTSWQGRPLSNIFQVTPISSRTCTWWSRLVHQITYTPQVFPTTQNTLFRYLLWEKSH